MTLPSIIQALDPEETFQLLMAAYVQLRPEFAELADLDSTPEAKALQAVAYRVFHLEARVNTVYQSFLIEYASGTALDALAAFYDVERLEDETDERLQRRTQLAISGRSGGGPMERYLSEVLAADVTVRDARVYTVGKDPTINVAVLSTEGTGDASEDLLKTVTDRLELKSVRVVSDRFNVISAVRRTVDLVLTATVPAAAPLDIEDTIASAIAAAWIGSSDILGKSLSQGWIVSTAMTVADMVDAALVEPAAGITAAENEALEIGSITVNVTRI